MLLRLMTQMQARKLERARAQCRRAYEEASRRGDTRSMHEKFADLQRATLAALAAERRL